jgi:polysaccharide pyruvyl transferase WcaK-like protein/MoaA/NifB/PqqE/SkfB family radical SAM enzyme
MCNIWQRKRDKEITPEELRSVLSDPLFSEIRYVGLSGGEPTLRSDLAELGEIIVTTLPKVKGVGIISNGIHTKQVVSRILALNDAVTGHGVSFNANFSLDGIGEIHDRNRGVEGNFDSVVDAIKLVCKEDIPLSCSCTLTPVNVWWADDVLLWANRRDIPCYFRIGSEIARVYNEGYRQQHPFTPEQRFHLAMFFHKLTKDKKVSERRRYFYASLSGQLAEGALRKAGCDWQYNDGVTLDSRGNISYCSVKSPILGSALAKSAWTIYKQNLATRRDIVRHYCAHCTHDLLGPPPTDLLSESGLDMILQQAKRIFAYVPGRTKSIQEIVPEPALRPDPAMWRRVLVIGWWGSETTGDKAILGELLHFLALNSTGCSAAISTLDRKVSMQTARELCVRFDDYIPLEACADRATVRQFDAIIIGGGPLMEIKQLRHLWGAFRAASAERRARIIFGCGVGPIYTETYRAIASEICRLATSGFFRDPESLDFALNEGATGVLDYVCDPAVAFVARWVEAGQVQKSKDKLVALLRANTTEYVPHDPSNPLSAQSTHFAVEVANGLAGVRNALGFKVELLPMHALAMGGDDRIYARYIASQAPDPDCLTVGRAYLTLNQLLSRISRANLAIAMRYHAHLFCLAMGLPFVSIDYSGQDGKVQRLISRLGYSGFSVKWNSTTQDELIDRIEQLVQRHAEVHEQLLAQRNEMLEQLNQVYETVFSVKA